MKTYSGKYNVRNPKKYKGDADNVIYRSSWEKAAFKWCDKNEDVKFWSSEETVIAYFYEADKSFHRYFPDILIEFVNGKTLLVEIKPYTQTQVPKKKGKRKGQFVTESLTYVKNQNKWAAAQRYCKRQGWEFVIWTENELREMKILPQALKKMKPFPPFKAKKKTSKK